MPNSAKNWSKKALLGGTVLGLGLIGFYTFAGAENNTASKIAAATPEPGVGIAEERSIDPVRNLVMGAIEDPEKTLSFQKTLTIRRGQNLMDALTGAGIPRSEAYVAIEALSTSFNPRRIRAGQDIALTFEKPVLAGDDEAQLTTLSMPLSFGEALLVSRGDDGAFSSQMAYAKTRALKMYAEGTIDDSLYLTALDEGVPLGVVSEMIRLFSFDVDFQREIWSGDSFKIYYERRITPEGEAENTGKVLAATLTLRGKPLTFYRYDFPDGRFDYFTADGKSARKMLMKTPVDGARLSSRFGNRKHPVLGYTRAHKGVDFAANTGTPIMAAGDGVVERASRWGSFGNYVRIRHNGTYKTAYAHLSGYASGIKAGVRVKQGQIIGYVGATGRVTGAHLHYEIHKDGVAINPLTLKLPKGESLRAAELDLFQSQVLAFDSQSGLIRAFFQGSRFIGSDEELVTAAE